VKTKTIRELSFQEEVRANDEKIEKLQTQRRNFTIIGSLIGLALIVGFLLILLFLNRRSNEALKQKNLEIHGQNIKLKESNAVLHQFTYVAAHDLKEPVRNIGSFTSLLNRKYGKDFNSEAREYMDFVMNGANRINILLNDLERYTSISMEAPKDTATNPLVSLKVSQAALQNIIKEKQVEITASNNLPAVKMKSEHLEILFEQLFENAIQHNEKENKIINIDAIQEEGFVLFSIEDNGKGITKEHEAKVFNLFYKEEKNWQNEGTGIGLTICKNIIDKYNGEIWFEQNSNNGTTFYMRLPAA
jgi:light-regulated signal transduction histidine kinase (bacteriophytochrome)